MTTSIELPAGSHYAVAWGIGEKYGGMTNAMLHRCRAFANLAGVTVTIVTYKFVDDLDHIRKVLHERGELVEGMRVLNLWEDLRTWDDKRLLADSAHIDDPGPAAEFAPLGDNRDRSNPLRSIENDDDANTVQTDYYRADGTLLVSDRQGTPQGRKRSITLCDTSGNPIRTWRSLWGLYHFWLDSLPRDPVAWMIVDSKTSANHIARYRREDVVTIHLIHGSHLAAGEPRPLGELTKSRRKVFENLDAWDAVVFLTQQQLDDVDLLLGPGHNRYVCPNSRPSPTRNPKFIRPHSNAGIMLASLTPRKRISHAIRAIDSARPRFGRSKPTLTIYGEGSRRARLEKLISKLGLQKTVKLAGFADDAVEHFQESSFSLLTSTNEGQPLSITESMAGGCIPISYDMPYGPADVITDGVDGYLVPFDDIEMLSKRIREISRTSPHKLSTMRRAAFERSKDFNDSEVVSKWQNVLNSTWAHKNSHA